LVAGRDFNESDLAEHAPPVAVVNESFARQAYEGGSALGKPCLVANRDRLPCEIIGIVKDSRYANLRSEAQAVAYTLFLQTPTGRGQMALHVRVEGSPASAMARVREEVQQVDKDLPMFEVHTLAEEVDTALIRERLIATLSSLFSVLALLLASVGLYGLLAFAVVQRTGEMGIRMALGAGRASVVWMVMRDALSLVLLGIAIGVPATLAVAKLASTQISGLLFGLKPSDPLTILGAIGLLAVVAAIAGYLPARRASRVDPMVALRNE
jgi:predicted permease